MQKANYSGPRYNEPLYKEDPNITNSREKTLLDHYDPLITVLYGDRAFSVAAPKDDKGNFKLAPGHTENKYIKLDNVTSSSNI